MVARLLEPVVRTCECNMLTQVQFARLLKQLNSKKFAAKIVAVDAEEVVTSHRTYLTSKFGERVGFPEGNYFNVHVEYVL